MKTLKELKGANLLSKKEQEAIVGGKLRCTYDSNGFLTCPPGFTCVGITCEMYIRD